MHRRWGGTTFFPKRKKKTTKASSDRDTERKRSIGSTGEDRMKGRGSPEDELEDTHAWTIDRELKRQRVRRTVMRPWFRFGRCSDSTHLHSFTNGITSRCFSLFRVLPVQLCIVTRTVPAGKGKVQRGLFESASSRLSANEREGDRQAYVSGWFQVPGRTVILKILPKVGNSAVENSVVASTP